MQSRFGLNWKIKVLALKLVLKRGMLGEKTVQSLCCQSKMLLRGICKRHTMTEMNDNKHVTSAIFP